MARQPTGKPQEAMLDHHPNFPEQIIHMRDSQKFVVERKCVAKLVSPLSFYMVSFFYIFLPLPNHSFEAGLLGSSSLPIFVCMHWDLLSPMWFLLCAARAVHVHINMCIHIHVHINIQIHSVCVYTLMYEE